MNKSYVRSTCNLQNDSHVGNYCCLWNYDNLDSPSSPTARLWRIPWETAEAGWGRRNHDKGRILKDETRTWSV